MNAIKNFLRDESGIETVEWALICGLIAAVAVAVYGNPGDIVSTLKSKISTALGLS